MQQTQLDWSTSRVHNGKLSITLDGKPPKEWVARFKATVRLLIGLLAAVLLAFLLAEFFIVFLLPRRVNRDPAIARGILRTLWIPWRAGARPRSRLPAF